MKPRDADPRDADPRDADTRDADDLACIGGCADELIYDIRYMKHTLSPKFCHAGNPLRTAEEMAEIFGDLDSVSGIIKRAATRLQASFKRRGFKMSPYDISADLSIEPGQL
jgi:hypothetical protein